MPRSRLRRACPHLRTVETWPSGAQLAAVCVFRLLPRGFANRGMLALPRYSPASPLGQFLRANDLRTCAACGYTPHRAAPPAAEAEGHRHRCALRTWLQVKFLRIGLPNLAAPTPPTRDLPPTSRANSAATDALAQQAAPPPTRRANPDSIRTPRTTILQASQSGFSSRSSPRLPR
jgi:hypothetical protein